MIAEALAELLRAGRVLLLGELRGTNDHGSHGYINLGAVTASPPFARS